MKCAKVVSVNVCNLLLVCVFHFGIIWFRLRVCANVDDIIIIYSFYLLSRNTFFNYNIINNTTDDGPNLL